MASQNRNLLTAAQDLELFSRLRAREDLESYGPDAMAMLALELRYGIDDLPTVADDALTDDKRDHKCDLLYLDRENGLAVIAQSYEAADLHKPEPPANKAADLNTALSWILDGEVPGEELGIKLKAAAEALRAALKAGEISVVEVWFIHNLTESRNVTNELRQVEKTSAGLLQHYFPDSEIPEVRTLQVSRERILSWYKNQNTAILVSKEIKVPTLGGWFEQHGDGWRAVCTTVPAEWLRSLYNVHGDELFSANVRGPIPSRRSANNINFTIGETARLQPGRFWAYNNGITALVSRFDTGVSDSNNAELRIQGIAIVNGAQTTGALSRPGGMSLVGVQVLARFVESSDPEVVDSIIRYNNSQNPIRPSDFRSRDAHQERLRAAFDCIPDVTYLGARRGGQADAPKKPSNHISSDTAAQSLAAFHGDATTAYHDLKQIWDRDDKYAKYFGDHTTATHIIFCWSLLRAVQNVKLQLISDESSLVESDVEALRFLRKRGATFLMVSAVGSTIGTVLGRAVANPYRLSFGQGASPNRAVSYWRPLVEDLTSFAPSLDVSASTAFQRHTDLRPRLAEFQRSVGAVRKVMGPTFSDFAHNVVDDPVPKVS